MPIDAWCVRRKGVILGTSLGSFVLPFNMTATVVKFLFHWWESCRNEMIFKNFEVGEVVCVKWSSPGYHLHINRKGVKVRSRQLWLKPTPKMFLFLLVLYLHGLKLRRNPAQENAEPYQERVNLYHISSSLGFLGRYVSSLWIHRVGLAFSPVVFL